MAKAIFVLALATLALLSPAASARLAPAAAPSGVPQTTVLKNSQGIEVHIWPIGAIVQKLLLPDKFGVFDDIVLGFDTEEPYKNGTSPYFGATVGRVANRIKSGSFEVDGKAYYVDRNEKNNTLHGGKDGWTFRQWTVDTATSVPSKSVRLTLTSPDGDEGFPGTVNASITYTLTDTNELQITMEAVTDKATPINMAQHTYFNLNGQGSGQTVLNHYLSINGSYYTPVDDEMIPTGEILPVQGTPFDFATGPRSIGADINKVPGVAPGGYDINYVLFGNDGTEAIVDTMGNICAVFKDVQEAVTIWSPKTGREITYLTNQPGVQFYSGNQLGLTSHVYGKGGVSYKQHDAFVFETQNFPNFVNTPSFPDCILRPGQLYQHKLVWRFDTAAAATPAAVASS